MHRLGGDGIGSDETTGVDVKAGRHRPKGDAGQTLDSRHGVHEIDNHVDFTPSESAVGVTTGHGGDVRSPNVEMVERGQELSDVRAIGTPAEPQAGQIGDGTNTRAPGHDGGEGAPLHDDGNESSSQLVPCCGASRQIVVDAGQAEVSPTVSDLNDVVGATRRIGKLDVQCMVGEQTVRPRPDHGQVVPGQSRGAVEA